MKFVSLISSGIDSPVATYMLSNNAESIILLHADCRPFTDDREIENFILIAKYLKKKISKKIIIYIVPHGLSLKYYKKCCKTKYTCIFCKRMLLRYAEKIAMNEKACAIIMGDSLGQVASQTLQNIRVIEQVTELPILRPLIGFDKEDIVRIAKKIGIYKLSILPSDNCNAVPYKPATRAKLEQIIDEEKKIDINDLVEKAILNAKKKLI